MKCRFGNQESEVMNNLKLSQWSVSASGWWALREWKQTLARFWWDQQWVGSPRCQNWVDTGRGRVGRAVLEVQVMHQEWQDGGLALSKTGEQDGGLALSQTNSGACLPSPDSALSALQTSSSSSCHQMREVLGATWILGYLVKTGSPFPSKRWEQEWIIPGKLGVNNLKSLEAFVDADAQRHQSKDFSQYSDLEESIDLICAQFSVCAAGAALGAEAGAVAHVEHQITPLGLSDHIKGRADHCLELSSHKGKCSWHCLTISLGEESSKVSTHCLQLLSVFEWGQCCARKELPIWVQA